MEEKLVPIQFFVKKEFRKLIKEAAVRRGKSVKEVGITLFNAWLKIKEAK